MYFVFLINLCYYFFIYCFLYFNLLSYYVYLFIYLGISNISFQISLLHLWSCGFILLIRLIRILIVIESLVFHVVDSSNRYSLRFRHKIIIPNFINWLSFFTLIKNTEFFWHSKPISCFFTILLHKYTKLFYFHHVLYSSYVSHTLGFLQLITNYIIRKF